MTPCFSTETLRYVMIGDDHVLYPHDTDAITQQPVDASQRRQEVLAKLRHAAPTQKQIFPELTKLREGGGRPEERGAQMARSLVERIAAHIDNDRLSSAIDDVYDTLDEQLLSNSFVEAEILIAALAQNKLPLAIRLSALAISTPWRMRFEFTHLELKDQIRKQALEEGGEAKVVAVFRGIR